MWDNLLYTLTGRLPKDNIQLGIMRGMLEKDGFRFVRESESGSGSPNEKIVASYTDSKGNKWVSLCSNDGVNPAQIDLAEQLLRWTADQDS